MIELDGPPARWVAEGGRCAPALRPVHGLPAYETATGAILVMEALVAFGSVTFDMVGPIARPSDTMLIPRHYRGAALRDILAGGEGLCALHDAPDAMWSWRPILYRMRQGWASRLGSQEELSWRQGLVEATVKVMEDRDELANLAAQCHAEGLDLDESMRRGIDLIREQKARPSGLAIFAANEKAGRLLLEHLAPLQRVDLELTGTFLVRGTVNALYRVRLGNGCEVLSPETHRPFLSMCIHPETWLPDADVALATKLLIESGPDGENELLAGARVTDMGPPRRGSTAWERKARDLERDLLPAPYAEAA